MTDVEQLDPQDVADARAMLVVDVRPLVERLDGLGYIPGSISLPIDPMPEGLAATRVIPAARPVVFVCLSGRRSDEVAQAVARSREPGTTANLEGGFLAWQAAELEVAGLDAKWNRPVAVEQDLASTCREIAACFMAEAVELSLDVGMELDPMKLFDTCCAEAGVDPEQPTREGLLRVLDLAAARSRELGNEYDRIAHNLDKMLALLGVVSAPAH